MANASGPATTKPMAGEYRHAASGVNFRIESQDGKLWLNFDRPGDAAVHGRRELLYYIGQGRRGRTYLFSVDGFLFESPINWYSGRKQWDMTPAYGEVKEAPLNLPALPSCMGCHTSGFRPPIQGSENKYPNPPFEFAGVTCERCHGPGEAHAVRGAPIVNPAKLEASKRDAICMQCHLEGNASVERSGRHLYDYRPGDNLSDYVHYFVLTDSQGHGLRATGQFEALAQSACKKKSGDAMWCGSCHESHRSVSAEEKVAFYRGKCLSCHGAEFGVRHHPDQPECTSCHMPASSSTDVAHTQVTDHRIPKRPLSTLTAAPSNPQLVAFPAVTPTAATDRDKAVAWEYLSDSGMMEAEQRLEVALRAALGKSSDAAVLAGEGYVEQKHRNVARARSDYEQALAMNPGILEVENNLAVLDAISGDVEAAVGLWQDAFRRAPGRSSVGMNLAREFCAAGQYDRARDYTMRVLEFNPDLGAAKRMMQKLNASPPACSP